ncbi:unnamed protein product (macronuclear) [Paramecium tetraurelia]|uniref:RRM domain-containing protein n=1 Tax=Paramecium tetraurelia TaxID=5888 RepID=A0CHB3_PARTE|nr:uncharacterized protein GSPATT00038282001 [Paramecium tetraurelia]CAK70180.1 unnamed protein product [Paramecium tetraurelia]|eukprot:XP_001437577.1 hypothetical protein (macronuclear) [Paramecium tetraurelia strain d4-2]
MNQDTTNVILVVITNKANKTLGHDKYFKVFSQFGTIQRMLIFERSLTWKTFIEFDNPESAIKARQSMNDKLFCDDAQLTMNVYASKLTYITFQENNTGGVDYTLLRKQQQPAPKPPQQPIPIQFLQSQMQFQHQMSQQIQQINQLMGQLQQVSAEGFSTTMISSSDLQSQIEKQQQLLNQIYEYQANFQHLTDQYQNFLQGVNKQEETQSVSIQSKQSNRKKLTLPADQKKKTDQIEFIQSYRENNTESLFNSQEQKIEDDDLNFQGLGLRESDDEIVGSENCDDDDDNQDEEQNEFLKYFDQNSDNKQINNFQNAFQNNEKSQQQQFQSQQQPSNLSQTSSQPTSSSNLDQFKNKIIRMPVSKSQTLQQVEKQQLDKMQQSADKIEEYINPKFLQTVRKSRVIYARWFDKKVVTSQMLYNLFSIYGNIDKMIYLKERSSALIQYVTQDHAAIAKESLNDIMFYGQSIKIFFSNYEEISLKTQPTKPGEFTQDVKTQEEYFQGGEETHRIKPDSTYTLAPPCDTIQVSNLTKNSCQIPVLQQYLQDYGNIRLSKLVTNATKYMAILKYPSTEVAITVLANNNGLDLDGKQIQINFSKQKLI